MTQVRMILLAHGSRDPRWRAPFEHLQAVVQAQTGQPVLLAYMEFAEPTLLQAAEQAVGEGAHQLVVLPLFLAAGAHLSQDIPAQCEALQARFPGLSVSVLPPIGETPRVVQAIQAEIADVLAGVSQ